MFPFQCDPTLELLPPASEGWGKVMFSVCLHRGGGVPISHNALQHYPECHGAAGGGVPCQVHRVATCQGKVREKQKFSPGQGIVREFLKNVREFWPFDQCQGNVREFCHDN